MGNVRMRAEQINYGATNVKVALDDLDPAALIELNNRMNRVDAWKATVKTEEKTGAEVTFTNALALAAVSLSAEIEAEQDLHGQSAPYVGGAGKNKLPLTVESIKAANTDGTWSGNVYTRNGGTFEILVDNADNVIGFKANGTFTDVSIFNLSTYTANTGDILNGCPSGGGEGTYKVYARGGSTGDTGSGATVAAGDVGVERIYAIAVFAGTISNKMFYPMIRLSAETDPTFAPYSNICPISGHTSVTATDEGANLFDKNTALNRTYIKLSDGSLATESYDGWVTSQPISASGTVYFKGNSHPSADTVRYRTLNSSNEVVRFGSFPANTPSGSVTLNTGETSIQFCVRYESADSFYVDDKKRAFTIQLGQTVYCADINWDTGVMTVRTAAETFDGSNDENWELSGSGKRVYTNKLASVIKAPASGEIVANIISNEFKATSGNNTYAGNIGVSVDTTGLLGVSDGTGSMSPSAFKTWLASNNLQVCYELATPLTLTLTPTEVQMLKGYNRISADTGDITVEAYTGAAWGGDE